MKPYHLIKGRFVYFLVAILLGCSQKQHSSIKVTSGPSTEFDVASQPTSEYYGFHLNESIKHIYVWEPDNTRTYSLTFEPRHDTLYIHIK